VARVALVTGAGKGIGAAKRVAEGIRTAGGQALPLVCDVTQPESIAAAVDAVEQALGPIGILVNNAGQGGSHKFVGHDDALWHHLLNVNLTSVYYVCKAVVPGMIAARWGRIINIASMASRVGGKYIAAYTASKHGVLGLTRALAAELVGDSITVNAICPGYVDTPMTDQAVANIAARTRLDAAQARSVLEKTSPQNRLITPEEVAAVAVLLASDAARGITGQAINVDGGAVMS
jgi:NAD(P)-dependent dehydrogenase (short-subunit alcohol dehydrogenase family)